MTSKFVSISAKNTVYLLLPRVSEVSWTKSWRAKLLSFQDTTDGCVNRPTDSQDMIDSAGVVELAVSVDVLNWHAL